MISEIPQGYMSKIITAPEYSPPQTPTTTPVGGFPPPVSPPPYVLSENWKAHLSTPICSTPCQRKNPLCRFYENRMGSVRFRGVHLVLIEVAHSLSSPTVPASIQPARSLHCGGALASCLLRRAGLLAPPTAYTPAPWGYHGNKITVNYDKYAVSSPKGLS